MTTEYVHTEVEAEVEGEAGMEYVPPWWDPAVASLPYLGND